MAVFSKLLLNGAGEVGQEFLAQHVTVIRTQGSLLRMLVYGLFVRTPLTQVHDFIYKQLLFIYPNMPAVLKMFIANLFSSPLGSIAYYFAMGLTLKQKTYFEKYKKCFVYTSLLIPPILRFITEKAVPYKFRQKFLYLSFLAYHFFINLHFKRIEGNKIFKKNNNNEEPQISMDNTNKKEIVNGMSTIWNKYNININISLLFEWMITSINNFKNKYFMNKYNSTNNSLSLHDSSLDSDSSFYKFFNKSILEAFRNKNYKILEYYSLNNHILSFIEEIDFTSPVGLTDKKQSVCFIDEIKRFKDKQMDENNRSMNSIISNNININYCENDSNNKFDKGY
ncbi:hypothetical protein BCR36DRAFT_465286 [Piromyces finnis]|uniref:Uncharacterized protein n=1 Tax=Piromyces finnis TaxID=1754191 RepID=A0A1Y1VHU6_9FUNG|nr:hypothetical protein BCR36DRAFT_465286 [Piromyces finnis]|eukprot:ORX56612.1 hypothetical protein BCR36DRAFT_465286 [Piromyces finnis]